MRVMIIDPLLATIPYDKALAGALVELGNDVLFCGRRLKKGEIWDRPYGAYFELPFSPPNPPSTASSIRLRIYWWFYHLTYLRALAHAARKSREFDAEAIHVQWTLIPIFDWIFLKMISRGARKILTLHDTQVANGDKIQRLQVLGFDRILPLFDCIIVHTTAGLGRLTKRGIDPRKISQIPHGLLTPAAATQPCKEICSEKIIFMIFGLLKPYKGIDILIRAVEAMRPSVRECCRFVIAGKASMDVEELILLAKNTGILHHFDFRIGFIPDDQLENVLKCADAFVYPYREIEASGALMMTLQFGKPIIASNIGLFSEMLTSDVHGKLVEPGNFKQLSKALESLTIDGNFRARAGHNVKELADQIPTWREIAIKTVHQYQRATGHC
jgi:glycosyltransferase involved in cell wall biosynthesis